MNTNEVEFVYDSRLQLSLPVFHKPWEDLDQKTREEVLIRWDQERAKIPERIKEFEQLSLDKQEELYEVEVDMNQFGSVHKEIIDLASRINDLNIWFRNFYSAAMEKEKAIHT